MRPIFPTVSQRQAEQASRLYNKAGWTYQDVAESLGWSRHKAARVIRVLDMYGIEAFAK